MISCVASCLLLIGTDGLMVRGDCKLIKFVMADIGLTSQTKLKTGSIFANGICLLKDKKGPKVFIAHAAGLHIYEPASDKFEDVNLAPDSSVSCLSTSDDLVFFCSAMKIMAVTGNGKIVFEMDTFLAVDRIDAVHVYGYRLWLVANNMIC